MNSARMNALDPLAFVWQKRRREFSQQTPSTNTPQGPPRQYTSIRIFRMEKESELDAVMRRKLFVNLRDGLLSLLPTRRWDHPKASLSNLQNGKESGLGAAIKNRNAICQVIRLGSRFLWMAPSLCLSLKLKTNTLKTKQNSKNSVQNGLWKREKH